MFLIRKSTVIPLNEQSPRVRPVEEPTKRNSSRRASHDIPARDRDRKKKKKKSSRTSDCGSSPSKRTRAAALPSRLANVLVAVTFCMGVLGLGGMHFALRDWDRWPPRGQLLLSNGRQVSGAAAAPPAGRVFSTGADQPEREERLRRAVQELEAQARSDASRSSAAEEDGPRDFVSRARQEQREQQQHQQQEEGGKLEGEWRNPEPESGQRRKPSRRAQQPVAIDDQDGDVSNGAEGVGSAHTETLKSESTSSAVRVRGQLPVYNARVVREADPVRFTKPTAAPLPADSIACECARSHALCPTVPQPAR